MLFLKFLFSSVYMLYRMVYIIYNGINVWKRKDEVIIEIVIGVKIVINRKRKIIFFKRRV